MKILKTTCDNGELNIMINLDNVVAITKCFENKKCNVHTVKASITIDEDFETLSSMLEKEIVAKTSSSRRTLEELEKMRGRAL